MSHMSLWRIGVAASMGCSLLSCGSVTSNPTDPEGSGAAIGGQAGTGPPHQAGVGGIPLPGCFDVSSALSSEELASRVEQKLGVRIDPAAFQSPGATAKARAQWLTESIDKAVRESGPPNPMMKLLHDFIVDRFLFEMDPNTEERHLAPFTDELPASLRGDMDREFEHALWHWMHQGNASLEHLFTDPTAYVNAALAEHYAIPFEPADGDLSAVRLAPETQMGLTTRGAFLARYPRPPDRALQLLEGLRCVQIPPIPLDTASVWDDPQRLSAKQVIQAGYGDEQVTCAACHQVYVGYAIALDGYDQLGRYRPVRDGYIVDTSASLRLQPTEANEDGYIDFSGPQDLGLALSADPGVRECLATGLLQRMDLGELTEEELGCVMDAFDASRASLSSLVAIVAPRLVDP